MDTLVISAISLPAFFYSWDNRTLTMICYLYPLYTGAATSVPPLCDHKTVQVAVEGRREAERLPWSFKGGTQDVQASPWTPWSPWSFEHVQNSRTKVAEEVGRSQVAQRRQGEGTHIAVVAEWMHTGRPLVAQLKMRTLCINLSDSSAFLVPPLCLLWTTNGVRWAITVATTVPPFSDHSNTWATMAMVLPSLCLLCASCCATTTALVVQGRHKGRATAVTQKQNFLVPATTERPNHFYGRTRVARRSQPCVKGPLLVEIFFWHHVHKHLPIYSFEDGTWFGAGLIFLLWLTGSWKRVSRPSPPLPMRQRWSETT